MEAMQTVMVRKDTMLLTIDLLEEISIWDITGQVRSHVIPASLRFYNSQRSRAKSTGCKSPGVEVCN